ncbi:AAA family ATPase [Bacteroidales bacterium OttesenSCG-928-M11]|nr:AAA family ATPase [Bacteroidales bacterium OttesenSCG-928-M11]
MDSLYATHQYLLKNTQVPLRRKLMDEINWGDRLIGIKGSRGVGKTSTLISYAQENFNPSDTQCLYINLNNFHFTVKSIVDFAEEFCMKGGKVLLIDQAFKYSNWAEELAECYDRFPDLQIIFSASSLVRLESDRYQLKGKVSKYNIRGFSFREYIELKTGLTFPSFSLDDILSNHTDIVREITSEVRPLAYLSKYLKEGYYPFHLENQNFFENLLKTMNFMLEIDLMTINQIEQSYLPKIRKLLYLLMSSSPCNPNISQLSQEIETSRATVMNYIKYMEDARLFNLLYPLGEEFSKKPAQIYAHNTNLLYASVLGNLSEQTLYETFFYNQVNKQYPINLGRKNNHFLVDTKHDFFVGNQMKGKFNPDTYYAIGGIERGERKVIPLWVFGFLY